MKDILYERLILLSAVQEQLTEVSDMLEQWDSSLAAMEKNAFELINASDKLINMTKEGRQIAELLADCYEKHSHDAYAADKSSITQLLREIQNLFFNIEKASLENNEITHAIEAEAVCQKDQKDLIKKSLGIVGDGINSAAACAELMLVD